MITYMMELGVNKSIISKKLEQWKKETISLD